MTTRRGFLHYVGAAGMVFCSCGLLDAARAQAPARPPALPVTVNGKRVKTIDVHAHCLFHEAVALMGDQAKNVRPVTKGAEQMFIAVDERLTAMDAMRSTWRCCRSTRSEEHPVDHVFATTTLSDDEKVAILGGNAAKLLGMSA